MKTQAYGYAAIVIFSLGATPVSRAEMHSLSDERLGEVTGQAFMEVENLSDGVHDFTRMTLGMEVEARVNIDDLQMGVTDTGIDFSATDVALGHISRDASRIQYNGNTYAVGEQVPFEAMLPYMELAKAGDELAGFRFGFGLARGVVSSDTTTFSGNIGLQIEDATGTVTPATLFSSDTVATSYRATHIGIDSVATDCATGILCAPLSQLRSLTVGTDNGDGTTGFTDDFFVGFQQENVDWQTLDGAGVIQAAQGVFLNIPTSMTVNINTLTGDGLAREQTHYIDRGTGIF